MKNQEKSGMKTVRVKGMSCQHCVKSVTEALKGIDGITDVQVDLQKGEARFKETKPVDPAKIRQAIEGIGFEVGN